MTAAEKLFSLSLFDFPHRASAKSNFLNYPPLRAVCIYRSPCVYIYSRSIFNIPSAISPRFLKSGHVISFFFSSSKKLENSFVSLATMYIYIRKKKNFRYSYRRQKARSMMLTSEYRIVFFSLARASSFKLNKPSRDRSRGLSHLELYILLQRTHRYRFRLDYIYTYVWEVRYKNYANFGKDIHIQTRSSRRNIYIYIYREKSGAAAENERKSEIGEERSSRLFHEYV